MATEMIRKNIAISKDTENWIVEKAEKTGLSQSAIMNIAIVTYVDQQRALDMMNKTDGMKELVEQLKKMSNV